MVLCRWRSADVASVVEAASTYEKTAKHNEIMKKQRENQ